MLEINTKGGFVRQAVDEIINAIDRFVEKTAGLELEELPSQKSREAVETLILTQKNSVITGCLFLTFYKLVKPDYTFEALPVGYRGQHGDKLLGAQLKQRYITLGQVTAWGENIGAKGDQGNFNLRTDSRFKGYINELIQTDQNEVTRIALYMASKFAKSQIVPSTLPILSPNTLSFIRAKLLFKRLVETQVGGSIQQFLVAALLRVLRAKQDIRVETHNFNAADKFDGTAGDIEEFLDTTILRAYEVTMRPDWKNRLPDFRDKMDKFNLSKYIIIAAKVNSDEELKEPATMDLFLKPFQRDIAVVDIMDFLNWMAAELSAGDIQAAIQDVNKMLQNPKLGAKQSHLDIFNSVISSWLDSVSQLNNTDK